MDVRSLIAPLRTLEGRGLMARQEQWVGVAHELLREQVIGLIPPASTSLLHGIVGEVLLQEGTESNGAALLWDCVDHFNAAGDLRRCIDVVLSCAEHLVSIGEANAAYDLIARAQSLPLEAAPAFRLAQAAANIAFNTEMLSEVQNQVSVMRQLSTAAGHGVVDFIQLDLLECEIQRLGGNSILNRVEALCRILDNEEISTHHRLHAAQVLIIHADICFDEDLAHHVAAVAVTLPASRPAELVLQLSCGLIYEVVFGSLQAVAGLVKQLDSMLSAQPVAVTFRQRLNLAVALWRAGHVDLATKRLTDLYDLGTSLRCKSFSFVAASKIVLLHSLADIELPIEYRTFPREIDGDPLLWNMMLLEHNCIDLAKTGALASAQDALANYRTFGNEGELSRWFTTCQMLEIWIAMRSNDEKAIRHHCDQLLRLHHKAARCGIYDNEMEALFLGLCAIGECSRAQSLLEEYISSQRRDGFPPQRSLQRLIDGLPGRAHMVS
jgi:hypothetical protein